MFDKFGRRGSAYDNAVYFFGDGFADADKNHVAVFCSV